MAKAGFDTTVMNADLWVDFCNTIEVSTKAERTEEGYFMWVGENGYVITSNNPLTGEYYSNQRENEVGFCGYIGIEGIDSFVEEAFVGIQLMAEFIKDECFGVRDYI